MAMGIISQKTSLTFQMNLNLSWGDSIILVNKNIARKLLC